MSVQQDNPILRDILDEAAELPAPSRVSFLDRACGLDVNLRNRVNELLESLDHATEFLVDPTVDAVHPASIRPNHVHPHQLGTQIDKYQLVERIGEGGMGTVFKAHQNWPVHRDVALKVIKLGMDTGKVIARFNAERQALAMMDHPSIAKVLDAGATEQGRPYFVMELVAGVPITEYCDQNKLDVPGRLNLFIQVCNAVQHAHQKGIIHRDLKPSNILVAVQDGKPVPKIIDFGIAKATSHTVTDEDPTVFTEVWQMMGTPLYMSPEQVENGGMNVDTRSDVYALGVMLYELLTGTTPFDRWRLKSVPREELARIIREEVPPRPTARLHSMAGDLVAAVATDRHSDPKHLIQIIRGDLDWIVVRCLEKDRALRYDAPSGLARDILRHLNEEPIDASPPSAGYRFGKFVQRHRVALAASGSFAVVLVAATIVSTWQAIRATRLEGEAVLQTQKADELRVISERQELETRHSLRMADSFGQLLQATLAGANLNVMAGGSKDKGQSLLDKISDDLDKRFKSQNQAKLEAREVLAQAYEDLGITGSASDQYEKALKISNDLAGGSNSDQTLRIRAKLALHDGKDVEKIYQEAKTRFGEFNPITQLATRSLVHHLTLSGGYGRFNRMEVDRAEGLSRNLVAQVEQRPVDATTPETYQYMNQLAVLLNSDQLYAEAEQVARRALKRADIDGHVGGVARGALGFSLTESLAGQRKLTDAVQVAAETYADECVAIGEFHPNTEKMLRRYVELLARTNRSEEGDTIVADSVSRAKTLYPNGGEPVVARLTILAQNQIDNGRVESGRHRLAEATRLQLKLKKGSVTDGKFMMLSREALLLGLGAKDQPPDGSMRAQVFCALDEIWCDHPDEMPALESLSPSDVRYTLLPVNGNRAGAVAGTLADGPLATSLGAGIYLMTIEISPPNAPKHSYSKWALIADWKMTFFAGMRVDFPSIDSRGEQGLVTELMRARVPAITLNNSFSKAFTNDAPMEISTASTTVDLPPGRYRIATSSTDGVRVYVDGWRVINAWSAHRVRRDIWGLELDGGHHELRVEHFRKGRGNNLWIRVEPIALSTPGADLLPVVKERRNLSRAIEEQKGPGGPDAKSTYAGLLAHDGQFAAAAGLYRNAIEIDPSESFCRQQRAILGLLTGDKATYSAERDKVLLLSPELNDRTFNAHTAIMALLDPASGRDPAPARDPLRNISPENSRPSDRAICQLAQGIGDYREGRFDHCVSILIESSAGRLTNEARIAANLFKVMAMQRLGNSQGARNEFHELQQAFVALPTANQAELDPLQIQDRLICEVAIREAQKLIEPATSATRPSTLPNVITRS